MCFQAAQRFVDGFRLLAEREPGKVTGISRRIEGADGHGSNTGFQVNTIGILANEEFIEENPAAGRLFELMEIPLEDVNAAILKQREGETELDQIRGHAQAWIEANRDRFDAWVAEAAKAQ